MSEWPDWHPPSEMIDRQPYLPRFMAGGPGNPLGARALYLGKTLYRIHGTNQPSTIGTFVSSGCIRLLNEDVEDLYSRVQVGTRVVVLPGRPPENVANGAAIRCKRRGACRCSNEYRATKHGFGAAQLRQRDHFVASAAARPLDRLIFQALTFASRVIASIIAPGSAWPFPAISCALPCATEENRIGEPIESPAVRLKACSLAAMCPWSCSMTMNASAPFFRNMVSAPKGPDTSIPLVALL